MAPCPLKDQLFLAVLKLTVRKALATLKKLRFVSNFLRLVWKKGYVSRIYAYLLIFLNGLL